MDQTLETHTLIPAPYGERSTFYASPIGAKRLVVFVHGFRGNATKTWGRLADHLGDSRWWSESDLLFFGYDSMRRAVPGVARELREILDVEYPHAGLLSGLDDELILSYTELVLVGHSLGGVVLRRMLFDAAHQYERDVRRGSDPSRPAVLDATLRLFAPASAGFSPAGFLGSLHGLTPWVVIEAWMRSSPAYNDLRGSTTALATLRERTEALATQDEYRSLRAEILWPDPDDVVSTESYGTDESEEFVRSQTHRSVCKPDRHYFRPWSFVSGGAE